MSSRWDSDPEYKRNRAILLADHPLCVWCNRAPATTADHRIERDRGGDNSLDNLVPACQPCNSRRGQQYRAKRDNARQQTRTAFLHGTQTTPNPLISSPPETGQNQPEPARTELVGRRLPRFQTDLPDADSWGDEIVAWAKRYLGVELLPWQVDLVTAIVTKDEDPDAGDSTFVRTAYWSCGRQNGKSLVGMAVCGWWITNMTKIRGKGQTVITAANNMKVAGKIFRDMGTVLEEHFDAKVRQGNGREEIELTVAGKKSRWYLMANREDAPRGFTADLIWIDEVQLFKSETINRGFMPTMKARNKLTAGGRPLLLLSGTAGDEGSEYQINYRERALQTIERGEVSRQFLAEWSAPEELDYRLPSTWVWGNPSVPHVIEIDTLATDLATMKKQEFLQEDLNQFGTSAGGWLEAAQWDAGKTDKTWPHPMTVLSVESSIDDSRYVGVLAGAKDGKVFARRAFVVASEEDMWDEVRRLMEDRQVQLLITPSLEIHTPEALRPRTQMTGYAELLRYTGLVRKMIMEGNVYHDGDALLRDHILRAVLVKTVQGVVLSSQKSPGPIELARCAVWAIAEVSRPKESRKPLLVVSK